MADNQVSIPQITPADFKDPTVSRINKNFRFLAENLAAYGVSTGTVRFRTTVSSPRYTADDLSVPDDQHALLTRAAADKLYGPNAQRNAFLTKSWFGVPVQPLPQPPPGTGAGGTIIEVSDFCGGTGLNDGCINAAIAAAPTNGASLHMKAGDWTIAGQINVNKPNIRLYGDGASTVLNVDNSVTFANGIFAITERNVQFDSFLLDGHIVTSTQINYATLFGAMGGDPMHPALVNNSPFWFSNGVVGAVVYNLTLQHYGGYAIVLDARSADITDISVSYVNFVDAIATTFGDATYLNTGSWTAGIHYQAGGGAGWDATVYGNFRVKRLQVSNCSFFNISGNGIWGHSYNTQNLNEDVSVTDNQGVGFGRDPSNFGAVLNGVCSGNTFRNVGYINGQPRYYPGQYAVGLDTSGYTRGVKYLGNTIINVNGGGIDLDGFSEGEVIGNTIIISDSTQSDFASADILSYGLLTAQGYVSTSGTAVVRISGTAFDVGWAGLSIVIAGVLYTINTVTDANNLDLTTTAGTQPNASFSRGGANITKGIQINNTYDPQGAQKAIISLNTIKNMGNASLVFFNAQDCFASGNSIDHPATSIDAPVVLACSGTNIAWVSPPRFCLNNHVTGNKITYDCSGGQYAIYETDAYGDNVGPNFINGNQILGDNKGEFLPSTNGLAAGSNTSQIYYSNSVTASTPTTQIAKTVFRREGIVTLVGTCDTATAGKIITRLTGTAFNAGMVSNWIVIDGVQYKVATYTDASHITVLTDPGNQSGKNWSAGDNGVQKFYAQSLGLGIAPEIGALSDVGLLNVSYNAQVKTGQFTTGARNLFGLFQDYLYTGHSILDGTLVLGRYNVDTAYFDTLANSLTDDYCLFRYRRTGAVGTGGTAEVSVATAAGVRTWVSIGAGGGGVAGLVKQIQYNGGGTFAADGNLTWDSALQRMTILGIAATSGIAVGTAFVQADGGFLVTNTNTNTDAVNVPSGGVTAKWLITPDSLFFVEEAAPVLSSAGQTRFYMDSTTHKVMVSENTGAYVPLVSTTSVAGANTQVQFNNSGAFGASANFTFNSATQLLAVTAASSGVAGIACVTGFITADAGFLVPNIAAAPYNNTDVIQAKAGGVTARWLIATDSLFFIEEAAPAISGAGQARLYADSSTHKVRLSINGNAYADLASVAGSVNQIQYNGGGVFAATANLTYTAGSQLFAVTATSSAAAGIACVTGFISSDAGFLVPNIASAPYNNTDVIQAKAGGVTARWLIGTDSLFLIEEAAPALSGAGQARFYADSTSHTVRLSVNGSSYVTIGSAFWSASGSDIINSNAGNVGIGGAPTAPYRLDVLGAARARTFWVTPVAGNADLVLTGAGGNAWDLVAFSSGEFSIFDLTHGAAAVFMEPTTSSNILRLTGPGHALFGASVDDSSGARVQVNGFVSAVNGYYTASSASDAVKLLSGGVTALVLISIRNDGDSGLVLQRTSATARSWGLNVSTAGHFSVIDRTAALNYLDIDTTGKVVLAGGPGIATLTTTQGYIQADGGFFVPNINSAPYNSTEVIQAKAGGVTSRWLIATDSLFLIEEASPALSGVGQVRMYADSTTHKVRVSINGGSYADISTSATGVSTVNGFSGAVNISAGTGVSIFGLTISIGQAVGTANSPTFAGVTLSGLFNSTVTGFTLGINVNGQFQVNGNGQVSGFSYSATGGTGSGSGFNVPSSASYNVFQASVGGMNAAAMAVSKYINLRDTGLGKGVAPSILSGDAYGAAVYYGGGFVNISSPIYCPGLDCGPNAIGGNLFRYWNGFSFVNGFTGVGAFTNFTIQGGIITFAS